MAIADQAPQATLVNGMGKLQKNGSTIWYCERSRVLPSGIPGPEFRSKLILPWNDLIPMCVPPESEIPQFRKMRTGINRNTSRNAQPSLQYISTCVPSVHLYMRPFHISLHASLPYLYMRPFSTIHLYMRPFISTSTTCVPYIHVGLD